MAAVDAADDVVRGDDRRVDVVVRREGFAFKLHRLEVTRLRLLFQRFEIQAGIVEQLDRELALDPAFQLRMGAGRVLRSEEHTSELQSLMRNSYAVICLEKKKVTTTEPK